MSNTDDMNNKFDLAVNLKGKEQVNANQIASVLVHEVMHIVGGNLAGSGGHYKSLADYAKDEKIGGVEIPGMIIDAYFMELVWLAKLMM